MLVAKQNHIWQGHPLTEGDPYPEEVSKKEKARLIRIGLALEVNLKQEDNFPDNFPEELKDIFLKDGIRDFDKVEQLYEDEELQTVNQIGPSTETKINEYFD